MTVYTIAQLKFKDITAYRRYQKAFPSVFVRFNATLLAADETPEVVEGQWSCDKVVLLSFPDAAEAKRFHEDPAYQAIAVDRHLGADAIVLRVRGLENNAG